MPVAEAPAPARRTPDGSRLLHDAGGKALACLQCGMCGVVCPHAAAVSPWPRKEMLWLGWGEYDRLRHDPDIWLCRDCGHCARLCPRGADPAAVMAALRADACRRLSGAPLPVWLERWGLPLLGLLGWLLVWLIRAVQTGNWFPTVRTPQGTDSILFAALYPVGLIDAVFLSTTLIVLLILARGAYRQWRDYTPSGELRRLGPRTSPLSDLWAVLRDGLSGRDFTRCHLADMPLPPEGGGACADRQTPSPDASRHQRQGHILLTASLLVLAGASAYVAIGHWAGLLGLSWAFASPLPQLDPVKLAANLAAFTLLLGLWHLWRRRHAEQRHRRFLPQGRHILLLFLGIVLSGLAAQWLRLAGLTAAYAAYTVHLALVWALFAGLPWSPLAHLVYRTLALYHVRHFGRCRPDAAADLFAPKDA